jgi:hypothetical protein
MLPGVRGTLVSEYFAEHLLADRFAGRLGEADRERARTRLSRARRARAALGPASSLRAVFDLAAADLVETLGFRVWRLSPLDRAANAGGALGVVLDHAGDRVAMVVVPWGEHLDAAWRDGVRLACASALRWCLLFNATQIRLVDASRPYSRDHLEFDLDMVCDDGRAFALLWALLRGAAFVPNRGNTAAATRGPTGSLVAGCLLEQVLDLSSQHGIGVCRSLRDGVLDALGALMQGFVDARGARRSAFHGEGQLPVLFEQSLTIVYRMLFLLFAEARCLVPTWHPVYRDAYTIEALRRLAEPRDPQATTGLWETFQAISRLAHGGCRAGSLVVTPFNGRLFSPARTPLAESGRLADAAARTAIVALSTVRAPGHTGRMRIAYRDLGVEQLGAVYESVLEYEPKLDPGQDHDPPTADPGRPARKPRPRIVLERGGGRRKATGSFYTPRSLTAYLVRATLHPLICDARAADILRLRVVDPAMGSGAFLVAACHHLAAAYERALIAEGQCHASDIDDRDRAGIRRTIAQRCLYGVDLNPTAVQLARLSIWLATLAADRPLTFLDHHLVAGDSLVGASVFDAFRHPLGRAGRRRVADAHPGLFDAGEWQEDVEHVVPERLRLALEAGDTLEAVREKERTVQRLARPDGPMARWKQVADLWCACWFWNDGAAPGRGTYAELVDAILGRRSALGDRAAGALLDRARALADAHRFFHWPLEFPEVYFDADGRPLEHAGFDAVVGNPPWDMVRADEASAPDARARDRLLVNFAHRSGVYRSQSDGHPNRFQLFVERAFHLARTGGRIGLVVPWGLLSDHGCRPLRSLLFRKAATDAIVGFDNADAVFPIHRSLRFALVTATPGPETSRTFCRLGERDPRALDELPDAGPCPPGALCVTPALLARLSGDDLAVPDIRAALDLEILEHVSSCFPWLSADTGWRARFGRELNASDDRPHFMERGICEAGLKSCSATEMGPGSCSATETGSGLSQPLPSVLPVVEGKHLAPYVADIARARFGIPRATSARLLPGDGAFRRLRLAYRDVASATNRVTLIAAILPAGCVTTHTVFCLKTDLAEDAQWFLCGVMNSYVANYLVRLRVTTHVSAGIVERLPVPFVQVDGGAGQEVVRLAREAARAASGPHPAEWSDAHLQALVARLYGLTAPRFAHILSTFPLVESTRRAAALHAFGVRS